MKKLFLSTVILFLTLVSFAQSKDMKIIGHIPYGSQKKYIIEEVNTSNIYDSYLTSEENLPYGTMLKLGEVVLADGSRNIYDLSNNIMFNAKIRPNSNNQGGINAVPKSIELRLPRVHNGVLVFENRKHYDELYNLIDQYLIDIKNFPNNQDPIALIESKLPNYISFSKFINTKYDLENGSFTDDELNQIEEENFIGDRILSLFLNNKRMLVIGSEFYFGNDFYTGIIGAYKDFDKVYQIFDKLSLNTKPMDLGDLHIFHDQYPELIIENDKWDPPVKDPNRSEWWDTNFDWYGEYNLGTNLSPYRRYYGFRSIIERFPSIEECNPFKKAISVTVQKGNIAVYDQSGNNVNNNFDDFDLTEVNATLTINWGDNTAPQVINNYDESIITHTYTQTGDFPVSYVLTFGYNAPAFSYDVLTLTEGFVGDDDQYVFPISTIQCEKEDDYVPGEAVSSDGSYKLKAKVWIIDNWLGNKVGSYTHGYKYQNNKWKICISQIQANIWAKLRDEDCVAQQPLTESDTENQFQVDAIENKLDKHYMSFGDADIKSYHKMTKSGTVIILTLQLNGCQ